MVAAPTPKASTLVTEVTVMATPACWYTVGQVTFSLVCDLASVSI